MTPLFDAPKLLDLDKVIRSSINPRRRFNEGALNELASNIRRHGVLQPILCRPKKVGDDEFFEIVAGERRWRASRIAEQPQVPAIVREMTDTEALEIAVIENAQREDLHPLEEAEGFGALLKAYGHGEASSQSADDLAAKIGKSRTHIYNRLKLLQLIPDLRDAFFKDDFNATVAQQLARLPAKMQPKAFAALRKATADGEPINVRESAKLLRAQFHLRMDRATFPVEDAGLLEGAPACTQCPKMSGNEPDLFGDEPDNVCTDGDCFQGKKLAFNERIKAKAREEGLEVMDGDNARAMLKFGTASDELNGDYVYMDRGLPNLTGTDKTLARLLGTLLKPSALFEHPKEHTLREIVLVSKAIDSLRKNGLLINDPEKDKPRKKKPKEDLGTSVATARDTSHMEPSTPATAADEHDPLYDKAVAVVIEHRKASISLVQRHLQIGYNRAARLLERMEKEGLVTPMATDGSRGMLSGADASELDDQDDGGGQVDAEAASREADLATEHQWRVAAFKALHARLHDRDDYLVRGLRMAVKDLCLTYLDGPEWQVMAELWGWPAIRSAFFDEQLDKALAELDAHQLLILITELAAIPDVFVQAPADTSEATTTNLTQLCEDEELDEPIDWRSLRNQADFGELSESDLPPNSPARAGEALGGASQGGDKSPPENQGQAPQGAQGKEGSQLPHWVGQKVRIKGAKTIGEITVVFSDGALEVATPAGEEGVRNLRRAVSHELQVLPGQTPPQGHVHWPFPTDKH